MAGTALGRAFSLLLYASVTQGLHDVRMTHSEATVGQNVTLPCTVKRHPMMNIVSVEWRKKNSKLALYSDLHGVHLFWPNVTLQILNNTAEKLMGSFLHLPAVDEWNSGMYICVITAYPNGSIGMETELKIKGGVKVTCDPDSDVDVHSGENVTIRCRGSVNAQYRWTKNKELVSENETLELWWVTNAHGGVYTLTVNTESQSLQKDFTITVLTPSTSPGTDVSTVPSHSYVTEEGLKKPADSSLITSPTTGNSTTETWTMSTGAGDATDDDLSPSNVTTTAGDHVTSVASDAHDRVTSPPSTHMDPHHIFNSTASSYNSTEFRSTNEMASDDVRNKSVLHTVHPGHVFSLGPEESSTTGNVTQNYGATPKVKNGSEKDTKRSHLAVVIIVPILVLIAVAGVLYRRHIIKQRMALPPSFKPPPPPAKYTTARQREISPQSFPISRCNSMTELRI